MTYLHATVVELNAGGRAEIPDSPFPYWTHRFFALTAPEQATEVLLLGIRRWKPTDRADSGRRTAGGGEGVLAVRLR